MSRLLIGSGVLENLGELMRDSGLRGRAFLVSNEVVFPRYGEAALKALSDGGYDSTAYQLPDGEITKAAASVSLLYDWLVEQRAERIDTIVALGGGVLGDIAGFVAATFLRGMPLVQVPTTVLAMIDSSIGGKVGVNHESGKNLIGAFHPARLIVEDTNVLRSLKPRLLADGWAEAVKCGMILDAKLLDDLDAHAEDLCNPSSLAFHSDVVSSLVRRCAEHKVRVVDQDLREADLRMILNYGHTIGQGIEAALNYQFLLHGEAVSIGMVGAAAIAVACGLLPELAMLRQNEVLRHFGLPIHLPSDVPTPSIDSILSAMNRDKKSRGGQINWILLDEIGHARIERIISPDVVRDVVRSVIA